MINGCAQPHKSGAHTVCKCPAWARLQRNCFLRPEVSFFLQFLMSRKCFASCTTHVLDALRAFCFLAALWMCVEFESRPTSDAMITMLTVYVYSCLEATLMEEKHALTIWLFFLNLKV